jgi:hypothetical protein
MTNTLSKRLAAGLAVLVLGATALLQANGAMAESPPNPPSRFVGSVKVNGANATAGTSVEARIGSASCGVSTVFIAGSEARYVIDSPALDPGANPNCGTDGATVTFLVGGQPAAETGTWHNYQLNTVNLTVTTTTPTATTPAGSATPTRPAATPGAPTTGTGGPLDSGSGNLAWLAIGGATLALGAGTFALRRKTIKA